MKLIEIISPFDEGTQNGTGRNGIIKNKKISVNIAHIVSIEPWQGDLLWAGIVGTEIRTIDGRKHIDLREYPEFLEILADIK